MSIQITQPNPNVEVHLPNGKTLTGPRGTRVGDFLAQVKDDFAAPIVAAIINNQIHELTYPVNVESTCTPVTMDSADGARIYRRSLIFLLEIAFSKCFQKGYLNIDHSVSSGGYYCVVRDRDPLSEQELECLTQSMQALVKEDLEFVRKEVPIQEAIEYFTLHGHQDKLRLFKYRHKDYLTMY
ncbi:MAG: nucleoside kinase, partial [Chloroflexota bacterium]